MLVALASVLALGAAAEIWLRARGFDPGGAPRATPSRLVVRASADPRLVYELEPGAQARVLDRLVSINSHGFRDREYALEKSSDARRIVALGDSITFGNGLEAEETWPEVLEAELARRAQRIDVLNLGVTGYDTMQEAAFLEARGLAFQPDLIVVGFCLNDVGTQSVELTDYARARRERGWFERARVIQWLERRYDRYRIARGLHDLNAEERYAAEHADEIADLSREDEPLATMTELRRELDSAPRPLPGYHPLAWYASPAHVGRLRHAFESLAALARSADAPVLVVVLPYLRDGAWRRGLDLAYRIVELEARRCGFDVAQIAAEVRAAGMPLLQASASDAIHFNARGHRLVAELVLAHLEERYLAAW